MGPGMIGVWFPPMTLTFTRKRTQDPTSLDRLALHLVGEPGIGKSTHLVDTVLNMPPGSEVVVLGHMASASVFFERLATAAGPRRDASTHSHRPPFMQIGGHPSGPATRVFHRIPGPAGHGVKGLHPNLLVILDREVINAIAERELVECIRPGTVVLIEERPIRPVDPVVWPTINRWFDDTARAARILWRAARARR